MAMRVMSSIDIEALPEVIWDLMCQPTLYPEIADPTDRMLHVPDKDMDVGYTYREHGGIGPFKSDSEWTVTEFEPKRRQVHLGDDGTMKLHLEIDVEPIESGSRLVQRLEIEPRGAMAVASKVLWPLWLRRLAQRAMDKTVANVKRMAEAAAR